MRVVLVLVTGVGPYKIVELVDVGLLTDIVSEVVPFEVIQKDVVSDVSYAGKGSTFIDALQRVEVPPGCVSHHFFLVGLSMRLAVPVNSSRPGFIVIALNEEVKVASSFYHLVVGILKIHEPLHVLEILLHVTAADSNDQVNYVGYDDHRHHASHIQETYRMTHYSSDETAEKNYRNDDDGHVPRSGLLDRVIGLGGGRVTQIEEHGSKAVADALVDVHEIVLVRIVGWGDRQKRHHSWCTQPLRRHITVLAMVKVVLCGCHCLTL